MTSKFASPSGWLAFFIALVAGAVYPLAFAPLKWWPVALISIATFWWLIQNQTPKKTFWLGWGYGFGVFIAGVSWVYVSINTFGNASPPLAVILTILFAAILAFFYSILGWIMQKFFSQYSLTSRVLLFSILWVGMDIARGSGFVSFPWLYAGYSQAEALMQGIASYLGVHGVTLFVVILSCLLSEVVVSKGYAQQRRFILPILVILAIPFITTLHLFSKKPEKEQTLTLALVQPNVDQHIKWNPQYFNAIMNGLFEQTESYWGADLVVWPEGGIPSFENNVPGIMRKLEEQAKESNSQFITGIPMYEPDNRSVYYSGVRLLGEQNQAYHKQQLVPFGEYIPFTELLRGAIDFFDLPMSSFTPGSPEQEPLRTDKAALVPAICYEIAFSGLIQSLGNQSQDQFTAILTISNDTWFGDSWGPLQHFQIAQMRAIETGLPVIRGTNNGLTAVIDSQGRVLDQIPRFERDVLAGAFILDNKPTWFLQYGYWSLLVLVIVLLGLAFMLKTNQDISTES
ncbi:apolipoprotein N-acyltransferase [Kangiella sediminilitoris]|uniref:Apolipoprotein N-acyltransferase n=1 Tax=Kangiella sediminilitoris TaxID=1144748 RepID=A0A1B3BDB9_9GAMM|nr:apolipoprotein N-acyltransferase [Kangiella sediminilitoris]AOE50790.1 Apolipoprotein N-acyltransferase [Kangiella sediminilitoris]